MAGCGRPGSQNSEGVKEEGQGFKAASNYIASLRLA